MVLAQLCAGDATWLLRLPITIAPLITTKKVLNLNESRFLMRTTRVFASLLASVMIFAGCSSGGSTIPNNGQSTGLGPQSNSALAVSAAAAPATSFADALSRASAKMTSGQKVPNVFAAAAGLALSPGQIGAYISPYVTGKDRQNANALMALMPKNLRADFIYMDPSGHLVTNNPSIIPTIKVGTNGYNVTRMAPVAAATKTQKTASAPRSVRPMDYSSSCSPPTSQTGPYVRDISVCGMTMGWAFVQVPCGYSNFASGDQGNLYFELRGNQGSLSEGGLQYNNDNSIQPYVNATSAHYPTMSGGPYEYNCNSGPMTIIQGATYCTGCNPQGEYIFTQVGLLPPNIDPQTQWINMNSQFFIPNDVMWYWLQAPSDISGAGTDAAGNPSPCMGCSITKLTTIAQSSTNINNNDCGGYACDGSYFGTDGVADYIQWMEVGFGQYATSCNGTSSGTCQIEASSNPLVYYGGSQFFPNNYVANSNFNPNLGYGPYESYDGIAVGTSLGAVSSVRTAGGSFQEPLPPPPTPTPAPTPRPTPYRTPNPCVRNPRICMSPINPPGQP